MTKRKILYLGLDPKNYVTDGIIYHYPIIRIEPRIISLEVIHECPLWTHILFTSRVTVSLFFQIFKKEDVKNKKLIAIGQGTEKEIGMKVDLVAPMESQEGIIDELEKVDLKDAFLFFPHSSLSRPLISDYLNHRNIKWREALFYDTYANDIEIPDLSSFDEIVFTSPSTIDAFFSKFSPPKNIKLTSFGPITQKRLEKYL